MGAHAQLARILRFQSPREADNGPDRGPAEERWGEIAVYPELMNAYADELLPILRRVWCTEPADRYVYITGHTICMSCLLEAGRYEDLLDLLTNARNRFWSDQRFGAEALARRGQYDAALAFAAACRRAQRYDHQEIDRFCERILLQAGREDEAYRTYGPHVGSGSTYVAIYRDTIRRYPGREPRRVLLDLIEARGAKGKWFAAAKAAGFLDIALDCARSLDAEPATLVRAARDFADKNVEFSAQVALLALRGLRTRPRADAEGSRQAVAARGPSISRGTRTVAAMG